MIQILSVWDGSDPEGEPLMREALLELMVDPDGLLKVAPQYLDVVTDAAAFTGQSAVLLSLYGLSTARGHELSDEHKENWALIDNRPLLRPETYTDMRRILATNEARDPRFRPADLYEAAGKHNDERSWRLAAWFMNETGDLGGLENLLERKNVYHGAWSRFWGATRLEASGDLPAAYDAYLSARSGTLDLVALTNVARIALRQGKTETAALLAANARRGVEVRSLGLAKVGGNGYSALYANSLALQARIMRVEGREHEAQEYMAQLYRIDPKHPELYNARGIPERPNQAGETRE